MAVREAAGKLGLGLAALDNITSSSFRLAAAAARESKENMEKSIYIFTLEEFGPYASFARQIVHRIPWNSSDTDDGSDQVKMLEEAAYGKRYRFHNKNAHTCIKFNSLILIPCGPDSLHLSCCDASTRPLQFQVLSPDKSYGKILASRDHNVMLGEVNGKLYRLDNNIQRFQIDPDSCPFQVFDPEKTWLPLPTPPFIKTRSYNAFFLDAAKKVIGWDNRDGKLYGFDTTRAEIGWTYLTDYPTFRYLDCLPCNPIFVHDHHPDLGDFHIMFDYYHPCLYLSALFISNNFDTFQELENQTRLLPKLCSEYTTVPVDFFEHSRAQFKFVHLGPRRLALVIHRCVNKYGRREPGSVLLVEFEYEIVTTQPTVEIMTRLIKTRRYQYNTTPPCNPASTDDIRFNGAFML